MKRSEINQIIKNAKDFMASRNFILPPFAYWSLDDWKKHKADAQEIIDCMLGWDITDFGSGDFHHRGLFLFTLRNGRYKIDKKPYAEKIMIVEENQETPVHYHWYKMEDIINRGGGNLVIELYNSGKNNEILDTPVTVKVNSIVTHLKPGEKLILTPGQSICMEQGLYHRFYGEEGKGLVLVGEVSAVNDDAHDNCFYESLGRFPVIDEDEAPLHLLVSDYEKFL
jgi:D-lyxose ketol-isomerase